MPRKNIVVFGETGGGKSSVINLIVGRKVAPVSAGAVGCTSSYEKYDCDSCTLYDTSGLSEGSKGTVLTAKALMQLRILLRSLTDGLNLLVYVRGRGKILDLHEKNYSAVVHHICEDSVPVVLLITHCEMETEVGTWWRNNKCHFDSYGMKFVDVISGCAGDPDDVPKHMRPHINRLRCDTKANLERSIASNGRTNPWKMASIKYPPGLKNVIVFGKQGSGKSSIVNLILGRNASGCSDLATGCTFKSSKYKSSHGFMLCDTVGLFAGLNGAIASAHAKRIESEMNSVSGDGVNLLIMVINRGRITESIAENYQLVVNSIFLSKVPVLLVITHCESELKVGTWWQENKAHFDKYEMYFAEAISGCAADPDSFPAGMRSVLTEIRAETKAKLEESIHSEALREPWKKPDVGSESECAVM